MRLEIPNITFANGLLQTYCTRREAEAPFDAVRIRISNTLANSNGGFTAVVASTETALRDTQSNSFEPIFGGTPINSVVTSGPGWRVVTWGGAAASGNLAAGNAAETSVESDWITAPSLPRADGASRPLLLIRVCSNAPVNGNNCNANVSGVQIVGDRHDIDYARIYEMGVVNGDGVANLAIEPTNYFRTSASALSPLMSVEYRYSNGVVATSVTNASDSVGGGVQSAGSQTGDGQDGWQQRAILGVSTPDMPFSFFNMGQSGQTSLTFIPALIAQLNAGLRPQYILLPTGSRNDGYGSNATEDIYFGRVDTLIALCKTLSPKPKIIMWYDPPKFNAGTGGNATVDSVQAYGYSLGQARLATGDIYALIDTHTPVATGTPNTWDTADNLHPANGSNDPAKPATPLMAGVLKVPFRPVFGPVVTKPAAYFSGLSFAQVNSNCIVRNPQVSGSGTIAYSYQWKLAGVNVGTNSPISPTWAVGDIGKVPTCVVTVTGDGAPAPSTATFPAVVAAVANSILTSNLLSGYTSVTDIAFAQNVTDPFGNANTAWTVTEGVTAAAHACAQTNLANFVLGEVWTTAMYVQAPSGGRTAFQMCFDSSRFGATAFANFDVANGVLGTVGAGTAARISPVEEVPGWYRVEITATCTVSGTGRSIFKMSNNAGATRLGSYTGTGLTQLWYNGQLNKASTAQANVVT